MTSSYGMMNIDCMDLWGIEPQAEHGANPVGYTNTGPYCTDCVDQQGFEPCSFDSKSNASSKMLPAHTVHRALGF